MLGTGDAAVVLSAQHQLIVAAVLTDGSKSADHRKAAAILAQPVDEAATAVQRRSSRRATPRSASRS